MSRTTLTARLESLEQQISLSAAGIASQLAMIESERANRIHTGTSEATLGILKTVLAAQEAQRDRVWSELAALSPSRSSARTSDADAPAFLLRPAGS